jgi:transcription initiation factor TFIID TATA-box-binding protein
VTNSGEVVETSNIVASGRFDLDIDLENTHKKLENEANQIDYIEHSRSSGNRLVMYFEGVDTTGFLTSSGVFFFTGADSKEEIIQAKDKMLESLSDIGLISSPDPPEDEYIDQFEVQNIVAIGEVDREIDLSALFIGLGVESNEYQPELFPGLVYRSDIHDSTPLIFASGKIVVTGVRTKEQAEDVFLHLRDEKIPEILG